MSVAIEAYEVYMREKGNRATSYGETTRRLNRFFGVDDMDDGGTLASITPTQAAAMYDRFTKLRKKNGEPISVDYHRNALAEAKTFVKWCASKRWVRTNPFDGVQGKGRRKHGKVQLTVDEARKWIGVAFDLADREPGAIAALCTLLLGLRAGEVTSRRVRDVDDGCSQLWIRNTKTKAGERRVHIPDALRSYFQSLTEGRKGDELLFGHHWRDWPSEWVRRICVMAEVPIVCAHSMRGLAATLATDAGMMGEAVARSLGHESVTTTNESYAKAEAQEGAKQRRALGVLDGGKK